MKIFKKEKAVTNDVYDYLGVSERCVKEAENFLLGYLADSVEDAEQSHETINHLEAEADRLRRSIADTLFSGAYLPLMRGDIQGLLESIDKVPNAAESCATFVFSQQPEIPDQFREDFITMTTLSFGIMGSLKKAVKAFFKPKGKIDSIREAVVSISQQESRVDAIELDLTGRIFGSPSLDHSQKLHLRMLIDRIVHISDRAEDTADRLVLIAMKSVA